ncbi:hypothetical protein BHAP_1399 [Bifidobacterium hapali]|uniref:Restriction endonuclease type IV Mrr domain-containing protein n=1 Tax=Bifidobacterium hapali TaxID=1630172 RepID=A0A261FYI3_9BIFI|nr:hypothetical protein [Bifidobacterium hapali]OZG64232.1 hypothetical protein BHAP_1399 [Bifidobacterium hapali]
MVDPIPWGNLSGEDMETLLAVFICKQRRDANRVRPASGDNGIDLQVKNDDGTYDVYQVKKFAHNLKTSQKSQIRKSLKSLNNYIRETGFKVTNWYLVLPLDATPQNQKWFAEITDDLPYHCAWIGLSNIQAWATDMPEVYDYFHGNGMREVQKLVHEFIDAAHVDDLHDDGALRSKFHSICDMLEDRDPNYAYTVNIASKFDEHSYFITRPNLVFSFIEKRPDGSSITIDVIAKYKEATSFAGITFPVQFVPQNQEQRERLESFKKYGTSLADFPVQLTNVSNVPFLRDALTDTQVQSCRAFILPQNEGNELDLILSSPSASASIKQVERTHGIEGGAQWTGEDESGCLRIQLIFDGDETTTVKMNFTIKNIEGKSVNKVRDAITVCHELSQGLAFNLHSPDGEVFLPIDNLPDNQLPDFTQLQEIAQLYTELQQHSASEILFPELNEIRDSDIQNSIIALALLEHKDAYTFHKWDGMSFTLNSGMSIRRVTFPSCIRGVSRLIVHVGKQKIFLGHCQWIANVSGCKTISEKTGEYKLLPMDGINGMVAKQIVTSTAMVRKYEAQVFFGDVIDFSNITLIPLDESEGGDKG